MHRFNSKLIPAPLIQQILNQSEVLPPTVIQEQERRRKSARRSDTQLDARAANNMKEHLPSKLRKAITSSSEKGALSWISALPISEHGFALHKGSFSDALCL